MAELYYELRYESGTVEGFNILSEDFCNLPVRVASDWDDKGPYAYILLCGHLRGHEGDCDPIPPMSAVQDASP